MAYRCKVCGYKFKSTDDDLCPQCFTARDDVKCTDGAGHTHGFDTSAERNSFIEEEKLREKIPSVQELSGQAHRAADELQKKYQTYQSDRHKSSGDNTKNAAMASYLEQKQKRTYNYGYQNKAQDSFQQRAAMQNYAELRNRAAANKNAKKTSGCLVAFMLLFFIFPIFGMLMTSGSDIIKAIQGAKNEEKGNKAHHIETPSISMPDINLPSIPDFSSMLDQLFDYDYSSSDFDLGFKQEEFSDPNKRLIYVSCYKNASSAETEADRLEYLDHSLKNEELYEYHLDIVDENGDPIDLDRCQMTLSAIDASGLPVYYYRGEEDQKYVLLIDKVEFYSLNVTYFDEAGNQKDMLFAFRLSDLPTYDK